MQKLALLFLLSLTTLSCSLFEKKFTIVFTHNTNGWLEDCSCVTGNKYGGLARRASVFNSISQNDENAIYLDAGDVISNDARDIKRDETIVRIMNFLRYDAIGFGDQEMIQGADFYYDYFSYLPMISSNVTGAGRAAKVLNRKDTKIAIVSLLNPYMTGFLPDSIRKDLEVLDPYSVLDTLLGEFHRKKIENIILLSHMGWESDIKIAEKYPQLSLIISGHDQSAYDSLKVVNGTPIVQNGPEGERVSLLEGYFSNGKFNINHFNRIILNDKILSDSLVFSEIEHYKQSVDSVTTPVGRKK